MNILVLHNVEDLHRARRSTLEYLLAFQRYRPEDAYWYHRIVHAPSDLVRETVWDAVIMDSTAVGICTVRPRELFHQIKDQWGFLAEPAIVKVVFPQDDANCGGLMDDWFAGWGVQHVFSVRAPEHWPVLYPKSVEVAAFHPCFSGYIDDGTVERLARSAKPWTARSRLLGQRVTMYPPRGGRQGRLKGLVSQAVKDAAVQLGVAGVDISVDPADTLFGEAWYGFLGDCKFVLGSEGGLSIHDPYGDIADRIDTYQASHPDADFEEIEAACFPGLDGLHIFSGFSPRILEAAICGASQVLVEGRYLGVLEPGRHYIALKPDASNVAEVFEAMSDEAAAQTRVAACREALIENPDFRYSTLANTVVDVLAASVPQARKARPMDARAARLSYATALFEADRKTGFAWPAIGERMATTIAAQTLNENTDGIRNAAFVDAFACEVAAFPEPEGEIACAALDGLRWLATVLQALVGAPGADSGPLREGLSALPLEGLRRDGVLAGMAQHLGARSNSPETFRLAAALLASPEAVAGLASRLAPADGAAFSTDELDRLRRLDAILVRAGAPGLNQIERFQAYGPKAEAMLDLLAAGGHLLRLVDALTAAGPAVAGIVSRLLPADGRAYTPEELAWLEQVDRILIRSERDTARLDAIEALQQQPPPSK
jgi:hypothetical protein